MIEKEVRVDGGVGFLGLLTILFIGLKLGAVIDWSWWWVFAPMWIPIALVFATFAIGAALMAVLNAWERIR